MNRIAVFILCLMAMSCSKADEQAPTLQWIISPAVNQSGDTLWMQPSTDYVLTLLLEDDQDLDQARVALSTDTVTSGFADVLDIASFAGTISAFEVAIPLSSEIQGRWELSMGVSDAVGNNLDSTFTVLVDNADIPDVSEVYWSAVRSGTSLNLTSDDTLSVGVFASDPDGLVSLELAWLKAGTVYHTHPITLDAGAYADTTHAGVPLEIEEGDMLEIIATDALGFVCRHSFSITP